MIRIYGNETATMKLSKQTLPIRNERVNGSNPLSGFPCFTGDYLLKPTYLGILAEFLYCTGVVNGRTGGGFPATIAACHSFARS